MDVSRKKFTILAKKLKNQKIIVWGDVIIDRYLWGSVNRISPEAPVPVVDIKRESETLGGAANVANNLISLGAKPVLIGVCGRDANAKRLFTILAKKGIDKEKLVIDKERPTTVKTRVVAHNQQVVRFDNEIAADVCTATKTKIVGNIIAAMQEASAIVISDYCKGAVTAEMAQEVIMEAKRRGLFVAVDPKIKHQSSYAGASLITPNRKEAEALTGIKITGEKSLSEAGWKLQRELGLDAALITLSEEGMALFERGGGFTKIPTMASEVYDVTGAGDTVIGTFTAFVSAGATFHEAAYLSNCAAGIVVREVGTAVATCSDIYKELYGKV